MVKFHSERKKKPIIEAKFEEGNIVKRDGVVYISVNPTVPLWILTRDEKFRR